LKIFDHNNAGDTREITVFVEFIINVTIPKITAEMYRYYL